MSMDDEWFTEELELLHIATKRIFRRAIADEHMITDEMPDFEAELAEDWNLEEAFAELDEARDGKDAVAAEISKWREELAAA